MWIHYILYCMHLIQYRTIIMFGCLGPMGDKGSIGPVGPRGPKGDRVILHVF